MMTEEKPDKESEATPKGAVEVDETDLDQAAGGVLIGLNQPAANPTDSLSLNYAKVEFSQAQKVTPTYDLRTEDPEKKI